MRTSLTGTLVLLRATLKHDGRLLLPWTAFVTVLSASSVLVYPWVFPTVPDRLRLAAAVETNPAISLIFGPARDLTTADGFNGWRSLAIGGFLAALCAIFAVIRATRAQEDSGQAELLESGVLGRSARLMVGVSMGLLGSTVLGATAGLVTVACGGAWVSSLLLAATFTATGWMFTGVAAVAAQVGSDARTASSLAVGALAVLFVARGFAFAIDAPAWTVWANPLGWMAVTEPAFTNAWWPLLPAVLLAAGLLVVAFVLQANRDFGIGAVAPRPGPAYGSVRSAWTLAWRLNQGTLITWTAAFLVLGFVFGYFTTSVQDILAENSAVQQILAAGAANQGELLTQFLTTVLVLIGIIAAVPGVQTMTIVRSEELQDRVEPVLAGSVPRVRYYAANVVVALAIASVCVLIAGLLIAFLASTANIGIEFGAALLQAVVTLPAVWTVVAVAVLIIGIMPRLSIAVWAGVVLSFGITILGPTFNFWDWVMAISPFWHVPNAAAPSPDLSGLMWVGAVEVLLLGAGVAAFRARDIAA